MVFSSVSSYACRVSYPVLFLCFIQVSKCCYFHTYPMFCIKCSFLHTQCFISSVLFFIQCVISVFFFQNQCFISSTAFIHSQCSFFIASVLFFIPSVLFSYLVFHIQCSFFISGLSYPMTMSISLQYSALYAYAKSCSYHNLSYYLYQFSRTSP